MEECREAARTVPGTLLLVVDDTTARLLMLFDRAHGRLQRVVNLVLSLRRGVSTHPTPSSEQCPSEDLDAARRVLDSLCALHSKAGLRFDLCGMYLGLQACPQWRSWEGHRAAARRHAAEARRWLCSAAASARATAAADRMAGSFRRPSPGWDAWAVASVSLARRAIWEETKAHAEVRRMRHAVVLEFFDAWMVLNRL